MATIPSFSLRDVVSIVGAAGWQRLNGTDGHMQFDHPLLPGRVTIPAHGNNKDIPMGILESIFCQAGLDDVFRSLKKGLQPKGGPVKHLMRCAKELGRSAGTCPAPL